jgi:hypothetical protein
MHVMSTPTHPATLLAEARLTDGRSYDAVLRHVIGVLGDVVPVTKQTVANYHTVEKFPAKPDLFIVMAIASAYGLTLGAVGIEVPETLRDLAIDTFRWNRELAGVEG